MLMSTELLQSSWEVVGGAEVKVIDASGLTEIVPVAVGIIQGPVVITV